MQIDFWFCIFRGAFSFHSGIQPNLTSGHVFLFQTGLLFCSSDGSKLFIGWHADAIQYLFSCYRNRILTSYAMRVRVLLLLGSWKAAPAHIPTSRGSLRVRIPLILGSWKAAPTHPLTCCGRLRTQCIQRWQEPSETPYSAPIYCKKAI